jgi:hypothetical protein
VTATPPPTSLAQRIAQALDSAHRTNPCTCGALYYYACFHDGALSHTDRRTAAVLPVVQAELAARDAENTRLRAELADARAVGMREAATMLRHYCPNHGDADTCLISCHCPAADEIERDANALAVSTPTI